MMILGSFKSDQSQKSFLKIFIAIHNTFWMRPVKFLLSLSDQRLCGWMFSKGPVFRVLHGCLIRPLLECLVPQAMKQLRNDEGKQKSAGVVWTIAIMHHFLTLQGRNKISSKKAHHLIVKEQKPLSFFLNKILIIHTISSSLCLPSSCSPQPPPTSLPMDSSERVRPSMGSQRCLSHHWRQD